MPIGAVQPRDVGALEGSTPADRVEPRVFDERVVVEEFRLVVPHDLVVALLTPAPDGPDHVIEAVAVGGGCVSSGASGTPSVTGPAWITIISGWMGIVVIVRCQLSVVS